MCSPASIDHLPPEMLCELFKHLHPKDLLTCSQVNKRWYSIYTGLRLNRLVVTIDDYYSYSLRECSYPIRGIEEKDLCIPPIFYCLVEKPLLSNLKHLAVLDDSFEFDLNRLNTLSQLVHLEISGFYQGLSNFKGNVDLNFPKLKVLAFHWSHCYLLTLSIDCPELNVLLVCCEDSELNLTVKHPETIRKLETDLPPSALIRFKNVECLLTPEFGLICRATLLSLPKLKELRYHQSLTNFLGARSRVGTIETMKGTLREFLNDLEVFKDRNFKFRFAGLRLTKLDEVDFCVNVWDGNEYVPNEQFYLKNHRLIDPDARLEFVQSLLTSLLMSDASVQIPWSVFKHFTRVQTVSVRGVVPDENQLLRLFKSLSSLRILVLDLDRLNSRLSQDFYNRLPAFTHRLDSLIFSRVQENGPQLCFDFIGKLTHLSSLYIYYDLSLESLTTLARWLGKLDDASVDCRVNDKKFYFFKRRGSNTWKLSGKVFGGSPMKVFETEKPGEILNYFERQQSNILTTSPEFD